jgi:hypothetical protein
VQRSLQCCADRISTVPCTNQLELCNGMILWSVPCSALHFSSACSSCQSVSSTVIARQVDGTDLMPTC